LPAGSKEPGVILQDRDRHLLSEIARLRVISGSQAGRIATFTSKTRRNARLLALTRVGYLRQTVVGTIAGGRTAVYSLPRVALPRTLRPGHLEHQLAVSEIYASLVEGRKATAEGRLTRFELGTASTLPGGFGLIPDAYLELSAPEGVRASFLEVDLGTEALSIWRQKTEQYLALAHSGAFEARLGHPQFRVLVVTHSARRTESVRDAVRKLTDKVFWFADLKTIQSEGIWSPIWLRPDNDQRLPLV
jgi:hypothetical protein